MTVEITKSENQISVRSDYHPDWSPAAKRIGGRWDPASKVWTFDARHEAAVRQSARAIYGTDGSDQGAAETVTIRIALDDDGIGRYKTQTWFKFGRRIAYRPSRDADVVLGDGVVIISGGFPDSGGSMRYPDLDPIPGTVLEIFDVPVGHDDLDTAGVTVVDSRVDLDALRNERERLLARLAEVDRQLGA